MARSSLALIVAVASVAAIYQVYIRPFVKVFGVFRGVENVGNKESCTTIPELKACEKMVLHEGSGILYLACSTPESRVHWFTATQGNEGALTAKRQYVDYLATYDTTTSKVTRLNTTGFNTSRTLGVHGMDVVPSAQDPNQLYLFLVNHRVPQEPGMLVDSVIEIFQTRLGSPTLTHLKTMRDAAIINPNDIVGSSDGKSFYFTNYLNASPARGFIPAVKGIVGMARHSSSVGYCNVEKGCKIVASNLPTSNGIAKAPNDTFYVASTFHGWLTVLERQEDDALAIVDTLPTEYAMDNLSIDRDGALWAAAFPQFTKTMKYIYNPDSDLLSPTTVLKFSKSPAAQSKPFLQMDKVFEDNGNLVTATTTVVHDSKRGRLLFHGISSPWLTICEI